jgi:hypothetical protein
MIIEDVSGANDLMVDPTHLALRINGKPVEILGAAQYAMEGPVVTIAQSAGAILFSFANMVGSNGNSILVKNIGLYLNSQGGTSALQDFAMYINRSLTANDSGGTKIVGSGSLSGRKRSNVVGGPTYIDCRYYSAGSALSAGSYTPDSNAFRMLMGYLAASQTISPPWNFGVPPSPNNLFSCQNGGYPLILAPGEGFNIQAISALAAATKIQLGCIIDCFEVATPWA